MAKETVSDFSKRIYTQHALHPHIYVVCLAARESGVDYGRWINADQSVKALKADIQDFLVKSPVPDSEAWAIQKYEDFGNIRLHKFASVKTIHHFASFFAEYGKLGIAVLQHFDNPSDNAIEEARELLENNYHGAFQSEVDFVQSHPVKIHTLAPTNEDHNDQTIMEKWFNKHFFSLTVGEAVYVFSM